MREPKQDEDDIVSRAAALYQMSIDQLRAAIAGEPPPPLPMNDDELRKLMDKSRGDR